MEIDNFQLVLGEQSELGLALTLALMMFSVALGLRTAHFRFFKTQPKVFVAGIVGQLIALPLLTLLLCQLLAPPPSVALGMILIACCPGGNVSNLLVLLARGNTALSVSLTATSSFAAAFVTPIAIVFWSSLYLPTNELLTHISFDRFEFLQQTLIILAMPLMCGMLTVHYLPALAMKIRRPLVFLSSIGLAAIILSAFMKYLDQFISIGLALIALVVVHNALAFLLGFLISKVARADIGSSRAITFEVGIQNSGLGIVILLTQLGGMGGAAAVAGLWGTWHIISGLMLVVGFRMFGQSRLNSIKTV